MDTSNKCCTLQPLQLYDMHAHLAFSHDPCMLLHELHNQSVNVLSCSVTPYEYQELTEKLCDNVLLESRLATGIHPWWVSTDTRVNDKMVAHCKDQLDSQSVHLGEVGLDFSQAHIATNKEQLRVFSQLIGYISSKEVRKSCLQKPLVSIHAVHSATEVLNILEQHHAPQTCSCILHWFSGTSDELTRAVKLGCYFSINPAMTKTKRGKAYIKQLPLNRLVLETDLPTQDESKQMDAYFLRQELKVTLGCIQEIKSQGKHAQSPEEVTTCIQGTSRQLLLG